MSNLPPRILHIGQRKTGTTWLQYGIERAAEAGVLTSIHWPIAKWTSQVTWKSATDADYAALAAVLPQDRDRPVFATCEGLMVHDPARLAAAVGTIWPDVHILVTTRAPQDYLLSSFNNNSMTRHGEPAEFAARFGRSHMKRSHDLDGVAAACANAFGSGKAHFLPYELLRDEPERYIDGLESLLAIPLRAFLSGTKLNASPPPEFLLLTRRINAMIDARAPEILASKDWLNFMRIATFSAGAAQGLDQYFADYFRDGAKIAETLPRLDQPTLDDLASRMRVLTTLPDYAPYLRRYGLMAVGEQAPDVPVPRAQ